MIQPTVNPTAHPICELHRTLRKFRCSYVNCGMGGNRTLPFVNFSIFLLHPSRASSIIVPKTTPHKSEIMFPIAAAHMVDMPSATPRYTSIASPANNKMALSMIPNPTKGIAWCRATTYSWFLVGSSAGPRLALISFPPSTFLICFKRVFLGWTVGHAALFVFDLLIIEEQGSGTLCRRTEWFGFGLSCSVCDSDGSREISADDDDDDVGRNRSISDVILGVVLGFIELLSPRGSQGLLLGGSIQ